MPRLWSCGRKCLQLGKNRFLAGYSDGLITHFATAEIKQRWYGLDAISGLEIRVQHNAITSLAGFQPGEGLVDMAHREVFRLRRDIVP